MMESYVEVSILHNVLTIFVSFWMAQYISLQPLRQRSILTYAWMISLCGGLLYQSYSWLAVLALEIGSFFCFFRKSAKSWLMAQAIRMLWYYTAFALYQGSFHNLLWFVPIHASIVYLWLFYGLLYALLKAKWKQQLARLSYRYAIDLFLEETTLHLDGWLDSGNLLCTQGLPVLFVEGSYEAYFQQQRIQWVVMKTMQGSETIRCYACEAALSNTKRCPVLVCCKEGMQLPLHCKVLLNMNVMTQG